MRSGRPTNNPKVERFEVRLSADGKQKLERCTEALRISKGEVVRKGIDMVYETLEPQQKEKDQ